MKLSIFKYDSPSSILFGMASVIGLIFTVVYTAIAFVNNDFNINYLSVISVLVIVIAFLSIILLKISSNSYNTVRESHEIYRKTLDNNKKIKDLDKAIHIEIRKSDEVSFIIDKIQEETINTIYYMRKIYEPMLLSEKNVATSSEIIDILRVSKHFNLYVVTSIKDIFDELTGYKCSVSIEVIDDSKDLIISTLVRDIRSYRERNINKKNSLNTGMWYEDTSYKNILSNKCEDLYFASDNLSEEKTYFNRDTKWKKYYNSSLVVPIKINDFESKDTEYKGFLRVDNFEGGLNNKVSINVLKSISHIIFMYLDYTESIFNVVQQINTSDKTTK